jgi:hypothetical protein
LRRLAAPFVVARPSGARIRTRLRPTPVDEMVLWAIGRLLGGLAGRDLAARCRGDVDRAGRKRALTAESSSRWAGAMTRISNDQYQRAFRNLRDTRAGLRRAIRVIEGRLAVPAGHRHGRTRGYASQAERFAKQRRLQHLRAQLATTERKIAERYVTVCRGGRRLAKLRHSLGDAGLTESAWRQRWQAERLFLIADGEADMPWGNQTIRVHPDEQWLELRLPTPLANLSNTSGRSMTYRLGCSVVFHHRADEWAAQAASGAVRYDITFDSSSGRWYLDASWQLPRTRPPSLQALRSRSVLGVDLNADHLECWVLDPCGNPTGPAHTIVLNLAGVPADTRDGRLRAAITAVVKLAKAHGCQAVVVENLDFLDARQIGRETLGHGHRGRRFRHTVSGMPTRRFRDLLVGMAANADLWVVAVDPAWTSVWGRRHWQAALNQSTKQTITVHHAAAVVIGRRGLALGARRRSGVTGLHQRMENGELPARPGSRALGREGSGSPGGLQAAALPHQTFQAEWIEPGDQVAQDRTVSPVSADARLTQQER